MKTTAALLATLIATAATLGTAPANASSGLMPAQGGFSPSSIAVQVRNSFADRVFLVEHSAGAFEKQANGNWIERGNNGAQFTFEGEVIDSDTIELYDRSRNALIVLELGSNRIDYEDPNTARFALYRMTRVLEDGTSGQVGQPTNSTRVEYSCNEGIPLIVRYENTANDSFAHVSHDSFPERRLRQVPSGSGTQYSDGVYHLSSKGRQAILEWNGNQDFCTEIN